MSAFSWGANSHGQLGLGYESELCVQPQRIESNLPFNPTGVRSIKGGGGHVLVLDKNGRLFSCGWNNRGQLGIGCKEDRNEFEPVSSDFFGDSAVEEVACGWDSSGAVTKGRELYMWGSNSFHQLGVCQRGFSCVTRPLHVVLPRNEAAVKLSIGLRHCCVLTDDNKLYVFGRLRLGDWYTGIVATLTPFNRGEILKLHPEIKVRMIASGQNHLIISDGQKVIGLGENKFGQANMFIADTTIVQIASGWTHNGLVNNLKEIHLWGRNSYGQVGSGQSTEKIPTPRKLELPENQVPDALHLGSEHGLMVTDQGELFTWGWNEHGNCGNGDVENLYCPTPISLPSPCTIAGTGAGFCYAICEK